MRDGSKKPGVDPESAGVSKGRRHNVRAPARPEDRGLDEHPEHPEHTEHLSTLSTLSTPHTLPDPIAPPPRGSRMTTT